VTEIDIHPRTVLKIVLVVLLAIAAASVLAAAVYDVRDTLRWLAAAIFLALALAPAVGLVQRIPIGRHHPPRWLAIAIVYVVSAAALSFLTLHVIPPLISEVEDVGTSGPTWVHDFENWAEHNDEFRSLNEKYDLTETINKQVANLPSRLGDAANELKVVSVSLLRNALAAVTVLVLAFFLLLEGRALLDRMLSALSPRRAARGERIASRVYAVVRGYVTVNLLLAIAAGVFTWLVLTALGVEIAVPLAILVAFFDLVPLIGLTIGGLVVALAVAFTDFPTDLIIWVVAFLVYQQVQDRVVQPMLYGRAVQVSPLIAILALLAGAQILGILGALIAIPVAASLGVVYTELWAEIRGEEEAEERAAAGSGQDGEAPPSSALESG
jgi:predicted PurR-regulated permease PerM